MFFNIINFLLSMRTPEISVHVGAGVMIDLLPFTHNKILPESTGILPLRELIKIFNYSIADAVVPKIYFTTLFNLIPQVAAKRRKTKHDKCFFQKVDITFYCFLICPNDLSQFMIVHFIA